MKPRKFSLETIPEIRARNLKFIKHLQKEHDLTKRYDATMAGCKECQKYEAYLKQVRKELKDYLH